MEVRTDICSKCEGRIALIDGINRFECHTDFEHLSQLARIHYINQDIACAKRTTGEISVLIRIFHMSVVQIMDSDCKIIGFVGFALSFERFLDGRTTEIMSIEDGAEHCPGEIIGEIELQRLVGVLMQKGGVAHTHRYVSVAEADVGASECI